MTDTGTEEPRKTVTLQVRSVLGVLLVFALLAGAFFIWDLNSRENDLKGRVNEQLASLRAEVTREQTKVDDQLQALGAGGQEAVKPIKSRLGFISECLTEVQAELNTLKVQFGYAYPNDTPSIRCSSFLNGTTSTGGD